VNRQGTAEAQAQFESLYLAHYRGIYGYVARRVQGREADVADLVADIFAIAWRRFLVVPAPPNDRPWLFGVARHRLQEHLRNEGSRVRLLARLASEPNDDGSGGLWESVHLQLRAAVAELPSLDREVLLLVVWDGLNHAEAAAVLNCSVNAIALRMRRAKARLRDTLNAASGTPFVDVPSVCSSTKEMP